MNAGAGGTTPDCISLAIAFYQAPGRFPDLLHGQARLPEGVGTLLRLAGGAAPETEGRAAAPFASTDEIRQAARFFIEQALLAHENDHYRVLGVNPGASIEEIKEHHRLLMRLFHPDRENLSEDWKDVFATRINLAYKTLKQPESRAAYDAALRRTRVTPPRFPVLRRRLLEREPFMRRLPPAVTKNLPGLVLGGFGLLAALSVGMVYLNRPPAGAIGAGDSGNGHSLPREAAVIPSRHDNEALERLKEVASAPPQVAVVSPQAAMAAPPQLPAESPPPKAARAVEPHAPAVAVASIANVPRIKAAAEPPPAARQAEAAAPVRVRREAPTEAMPAPPAAAPEKPEAVVQAAVQPAPPPEVAPPARPDFSQAALSELIARMSALYEQGNLEGFLALFDEEARAEQGGKTRIRSDYENLFRTTEARKLTIFDMNWVKDGEVFRGEGGFQAKVIRKGERTARVYSGTIRLEVQKRNESALIRGIFHKAG